MTKEEFKKYKNLPSRRDYLVKRINRLEREAEAVPVVKDKVQSSQKDYPYIETHVTVDAPEPVRYTRYKREIFRARRQLERVESLLDELAAIIDQIDDGRTVQIMQERLVYGEKLYKVAAHVDLTEQHVMRIINDAVKKL